MCATKEKEIPTMKQIDVLDRALKERYLFTEDLATNGIWSFTSFYLVFNILMVLGIVTKVI